VSTNKPPSSETQKQSRERHNSRDNSYKQPLAAVSYGEINATDLVLNSYWQGLALTGNFLLIEA
jgi:hypothetical protein